MLEIKLLPGSEIEITGEISAGDFEICRKQALRELSEKIKIDGFRPGKVPEKILTENVGEQEILEKMAVIALQKEYPEIIEKHKIKAIGRPLINITKIAPNNPLGFKIRTFVVPEIKLPDYKKIKVLEKIIEETKMEIPQILIEAEKEKIAGETRANIEQIGLKWEDYLSHLKKTEEELRKDWEKDALKRAKYGLVLNEIAEKEKIEVSEEELEKEVKKITDQYKDLDRNRVRMYTYAIIRNKKVLKLLESC